MFPKPSIVALVIGQHIQMKSGDILNVQIRPLFSLPEIDDFNVPLALIADVNAVPLIPFNREVS